VRTGHAGCCNAAERSVGLELADGVIEAVQGRRARLARPTTARGHHARHHLILPELLKLLKLTLRCLAASTSWMGLKQGVGGQMQRASTCALASACLRSMRVDGLAGLPVRASVCPRSCVHARVCMWALCACEHSCTRSPQAAGVENERAHAAGRCTFASIHARAGGGR
jgi:hypothetical protein